MDLERDKQRYIVLQPEQFDDDAVIEALESEPAYNRDRKLTDKIRTGVHRPAEEPAAPQTRTPRATDTPDSRDDAPTTLITW